MEFNERFRLTVPPTAADPDDRLKFTWAKETTLDRNRANVQQRVNTIGS